MARCVQCGYQLEEGATICSNCGKLNVASSAKGNSLGKTLAIIAGIAIFFIIIYFAMMKLTSRTVGAATLEEAVENWIVAEINIDTEAALGALFPDEILGVIYQNQMMTRQEGTRKLDRVLANSVLETEREVRNVKVIDEGKVERKRVAEFTRNLASVTRMPSNHLDVKEVRKVSLSFEYKFGENGKWEKVECDIHAYKYGDKWYAFPYDF